MWKTSAWSECDILPGSSGSEDGDDDGERGPCGGGLASREVFCTHVNDTGKKFGICKAGVHKKCSVKI